MQNKWKFIGFLTGISGLNKGGKIGNPGKKW
jgi:hypothetical protein